MQLVELQKELQSLKDKKIQVVGISYDSEETLKGFSDKEKIGFPLLADPGSETIKAFGLLNPKGRGVPYPGTMILDKDRKIRAKIFINGYRERHEPTEIIKAVSELK